MDDIFSKEFNDDITNMVDKIVGEELDSNKLETKMQRTVLVYDYLRKMGKTPENYMEVIPASFDLLNLDTQIKVLEECFDRDCVIEKSKTYLSALEGTVEPNFYQEPERSK